MTTDLQDLDRARDEVSASSAGGAPFLIAFGLTLAASAVLSYFLPIRTAALVVIFQGGVGLPLAFWLEHRMGTKRMSAENPLRPLSVQLAMSQIVALPAVIVAFSLRPDTVPVVLAAIGGGHFLPYAWLHRTRLYTVLGVAVALGAFALQAALQNAAFPYILFYISALYALAAPLVYRHAARLVARAA